MLRVSTRYWTTPTSSVDGVQVRVTVVGETETATGAPGRLGGCVSEAALRWTSPTSEAIAYEELAATIATVAIASSNETGRRFPLRAIMAHKIDGLRWSAHPDGDSPTELR